MVFPLAVDTKHTARPFDTLTLLKFIQKSIQTYGNVSIGLCVESMWCSWFWFRKWSLAAHIISGGWLLALPEWTPHCIPFHFSLTATWIAVQYFEWYGVPFTVVVWKSAKGKRKARAYLNWWFTYPFLVRSCFQIF